MVDPEAAREAAEYSSSLDESPFGSSGGLVTTGSEEEDGHEAEAESDGDEEPEEPPEPPRARVSQRRLQLQQKLQQRARQQEEGDGLQDSVSGQGQGQQRAARVGPQESRLRLAQCAVQQPASPPSVELCAVAPQPTGLPQPAVGAGGVFLARSLSHTAATCSSSDVQQLQLAGYPCSMQQQDQYGRSYSTPLLAVAGYNSTLALQLQQGTTASGSPAFEQPSHPAGSSGGGAAGSGSGSGRHMGLVTYGSDAAAIADCCSGPLLQLCGPQQQHHEQQQSEYQMGSSRYGAYSGGRGNCTGSNGGSGDAVFGRRAAAAVPVGTAGSLQESPGCAVPQSAASPAPVPILAPALMPGLMASRDAMDMDAGEDDQDPEWLVLMQSLETAAAGGDLAAAEEWDTPAQWADSVNGGGGNVTIKQEHEQEQQQQQQGPNGAGVAAVRSWLYDGDGPSVGAGVGAGASSSGMATVSPFVAMEGSAVAGDGGALLSPWSSPPCAAAGQQQQALGFHPQNQPQLLQLQQQGSGAAGSPLLTAMLPQTTSMSYSEVRHAWNLC